MSIPKAKSIVVVGSSNVDLIMKVPRLPALGETVTDGTFAQVFGGKGANQAVGAARAGGRVTFVNCIGDDAYAERMVEGFTGDKIDCTYVYRETGIASGHALVMVGAAGGNYLTVAPGANYRLTPERVDAAAGVIRGAAVLLVQNEIPLATTARAMAIAHAAGVRILWNFAPSAEFPRHLLDYAPGLIVNEVEAAAVTGVAQVGRENAAEVARRMVEMGCSLAVVTLGEAGAVALARGTEEAVYVPAFSVEAVDTTAAGDVFCGTLAVALSEDHPLAESLRFASAAAAHSVTVFGAQPSAPTREAVEAILGG